MKNFLKSFVKNIKKKFIKSKISPLNFKNKIMSGLSGKSAKKFFTGDDSLSINAKQELLKAGINEEARILIKEAINNPELLVKFIESKGTKVIKSKYMEQILFLFGEQEGFLMPMKGLKAFLFINIINIFSHIKI